MKAPRDGRTVGVCGNFGSNRGRDVNELINTAGHRHHTQWSTSFRDKVTVKAADSFFKCGDVYDYAYTYSPYKFKSMRANQMVSVAQRMSMATEALAAEPKLLQLECIRCGESTLEKEKHFHYLKDAGSRRECRCI